MDSKSFEGKTVETVPNINNMIYGSINYGIEAEIDDNKPFHKFERIRTKKRDSSFDKAKRLFESIRSTVSHSKRRVSKAVLPLNNQTAVKYLFDKFITFCAAYSVISSLYYLGFKPPDKEQQNFDYFIWACFILDFLLKFVSEASSSKGEIINDYTGIFFQYLKTWMILDIASLLPLHLSGNPNAEYWLRLFRIFKLHNLMKLMKIEDFINDLTLSIFKGDLRKKKQLNIVMNFGWSLLHQILGMLFFSYALACLWSYYTILIETYKNEPNYFREAYLTGETDQGKLIKIWYFIYTTLMTVGYGDISAKNSYEMGFCILLLIIAPTLYAIFMSKSVDTIIRLKSAGKDNERTKNFEVWLNSVEHNYDKLAPELKQNIISHFKNFFQNDRAQILAEKHWTFGNKNDYTSYHNMFLKDLPPELRKQILGHLFCQTFYSFKVFFGDEDDFRYFVCLHIQPRIYKNQDVIIKEDTIPSEILFMEEGEVLVGHEVDGVFQSVYEYKSRVALGDYFVIFKCPSIARFVVSERLVGFSLPGKVVKKVGKKFPLQFGNIKTRAQKKAGILTRNLNIELSTLNTSGKENTQKKIGGIVKKPKQSLRSSKLKTGSFNLSIPETGALKEVSKEVNNSKRRQNTLLAELNEKLQELLDIKDKYRTND